eukprot:15366716-Ditylum_brightwellii.AAC.3
MKTQLHMWYGGSKVQRGNNELALSAFDGKCYKCREMGHKANKCPKKKCGKFNGKCNRCGRTSHKFVKCWENDKNAHKRTNWFKSNKKKGLAAVDGDDNGQYDNT